MSRYTLIFTSLLISAVFSTDVARADILYGVNASNKGLLQYDQDTGNSTLIGAFGPGYSTPVGFDIDPLTGTFYGWSTSGINRGLFSIDPANATPTTIGTNMNNLVSAITFDNSGNLYGLDTSIFRLSNDGSLISQTQFSESIRIFGADFDANGTLYGIGTEAAIVHLYTIDPVTGDVLTDTSLGLNGTAGGLGFDSDGRLFGFYFNSSFRNMFEVDPSSGNVLSVVNVSGDGFVAQGAAFHQSIPEPGSLLLLTAGLITMASRRRRTALPAPAQQTH